MGRCDQHGKVLFDDGDVCVIDKPSGLPVLRAGGSSEHTLLRLLERRHLLLHRRHQSRL